MGVLFSKEFDQPFSLVLLIEEKKGRKGWPKICGCSFWRGKRCVSVCNVDRGRAALPPSLPLWVGRGSEGGGWLKGSPSSFVGGEREGGGTVS